jgi:hypothetical protein
MNSAITERQCGAWRVAGVALSTMQNAMLICDYREDLTEVFIWGANGKRRQMTKGQMAMIVVVNTFHSGDASASSCQLAQLLA